MEGRRSRQLMYEMAEGPEFIVDTGDYKPEEIKECSHEKKAIFVSASKGNNYVLRSLLTTRRKEEKWRSIRPGTRTITSPLYPLFIQFLKDHCMADLVPEPFIPISVPIPKIVASISPT